MSDKQEGPVATAVLANGDALIRSGELQQYLVSIWLWALANFGHVLPEFSDHLLNFCIIQRLNFTPPCVGVGV